MAELPRIASSLFSGRSLRTRSERFFVFEAVSSLLPDFSSGGKASLFSCGDAVFAFSAAFSFSADSEAPSRCSDWREAFSLSVCIGLFPARPLFGRDAQDTDTKKIDRQAIAVSDVCINSRTKLALRFIITNFEFLKTRNFPTCLSVAPKGKFCATVKTARRRGSGSVPFRALRLRERSLKARPRLSGRVPAVSEACIDFHTKLAFRFIDFFTEQPPIYPKRFYRLHGADLPSLCPQAA